jgi:hypothetical protein
MISCASRSDKSIIVQTSPISQINDTLKEKYAVVSDFLDTKIKDRSKKIMILSKKINTNMTLKILRLNDICVWDSIDIKKNYEDKTFYKEADWEIARKKYSKNLIQLIGGDVLAAYINNPLDVRGFCALKVSRGLNGAGIIIPNLPGKTIKGGDNKYYFLNAKALNKWMRKTFGTNDGDPTTPHNPNHTHFISTQGGLNGINFPQLTANMKGIFSMVTDDPDHNWASGHADLINNGTCIFGCHFHDVPTAILDYIDIWKLN